MDVLDQVRIFVDHGHHPAIQDRGGRLVDLGEQGEVGGQPEPLRRLPLRTVGALGKGKGRGSQMTGYRETG